MKHQRYKLDFARDTGELHDRLNAIGAEPGWRVFQVIMQQNTSRQTSAFHIIAEQAMAHGVPTEEDA